MGRSAHTRHISDQVQMISVYLYAIPPVPIPSNMHEQSVTTVFRMNYSVHTKIERRNPDLIKKIQVKLMSCLHSE